MDVDVSVEQSPLPNLPDQIKKLTPKQLLKKQEAEARRLEREKLKQVNTELRSFKLLSDEYCV